MATAAICAAQGEPRDQTKPSFVLNETKSPDARYAVGWGLPKHPDVWERVSAFDRKYPRGSEDNEPVPKEVDEISDMVAGVAQDVENYIVDAGDGRILQKLDCPRTPGIERELEPQYWAIAGFLPNRHELEVAWTRAGNLVLVNHTWRWDCVTFCAVAMRDGKAGPIVDLNKKLEDAVRNYIAKSFPRHFQYSKKDLNICFSQLKQLSETKFSAHVEAVVEKYWSSDGATVHFALSPAGENNFTLSAISVGPVE